MKTSLVRRSLFAAGAALLLIGGLPPAAMAQNKIPLRISTPAVPDDWHAKMWTVFKESLDKSAPGEFDVQINLNATLFKQGTEPAAMARGNLELATISAFDIAKLVPEFSIFTAGYIIRDPDHMQKVFNGPIGEEMFKPVAEKMDVTVLSTIYLGTRQVNLREVRNVKVARRPQGREAADAGLEGMAVPRRGAGRDGDAAGLRRGLPGPEDRHHRRPGQPAAIGAGREVLRSHQAAGADQPPRRRHLPVDREQDLDRAHARPEAEGQGSGPRRGAVQQREPA